MEFSRRLRDSRKAGSDNALMALQELEECMSRDVFGISSDCMAERIVRCLARRSEFLAGLPAPVNGGMGCAQTMKRLKDCLLRLRQAIIQCGIDRRDIGNDVPETLLEE
jgi:hypothetical protein